MTKTERMVSNYHDSKIRLRDKFIHKLSRIHMKETAKASEAKASINKLEETIKEVTVAKEEHQANAKQVMKIMQETV